MGPFLLMGRKTVENAGRSVVFQPSEVSMPSSRTAPAALILAAIAALSLVLMAGDARAAAFAIDDRSASQLGVANAGAAAAAEDAGTIADNPAGIARLTIPQLVATGIFVSPHLPFRD